MPIEILFSLTPGSHDPREINALDRFRESIPHAVLPHEIQFTDSALQTIWSKLTGTSPISIGVVMPPSKLREVVERLTIQSAGQVFVTRKMLPELCAALGISEANQTANALTALTKPAHHQRKSRFPQVELLAVAQTDRDDINLTALCRIVRQDYFELAYLACETAGPIRLQYLKRFARMIDESQILAVR
jgi:hypothetical protein